jgi:hypothetical protein
VRTTLLGRSKNVALVATIAATLQFSTAGATDAPLQVGPVHPGDRASFAFTFDGHFSESPEHFSDTIVAQLKPGGAFVVNAPQFKPFTLTTKRDADGLLAPAPVESALGDILIDYNSIVTLAKHTGPTGAGDTWQAQIPVRISPDTWHDLPVDVKVASSGGSGVNLVGQGHDETTLFYHGYTFAVDVTLQMTEAYGAGGAFKTAQFNVNEITAGGSGPPISYAWNFTAQ